MGVEGIAFRFVSCDFSVAVSHTKDHLARLVHRSKPLKPARAVLCHCPEGIFLRLSVCSRGSCAFVGAFLSGSSFPLIFLAAEGDNCLWIITEADKNVTTFLLPCEY
jgi:hypothetical protein